VESADVDVVATGTGGATITQLGRQGRYWDAQVLLQNQTNPRQDTLSVTATLAHTGASSDVLTDTRVAQIAQALQSFTYDADGNLTSDGMWDYQWDAENRLVRVVTTTNAVNWGIPNRVLEFKYDYAGRRVEKHVVNLSAGTDTTTRYLYNGWNLHHGIEPGP